MLRPRHPEDECDAVPGEERARRPDERVLPSKDDPELEHGTRADGDEDLRDRETEVERNLAEDLERDDDRSQMQTRVANARQDDRIRLSTDREPVLGSESGLLGHELPPRQYARTWFANSRTLIGFSRYPANPASRTHSPPAPKADDVSATIGIPAVRG